MKSKTFKEFFEKFKEQSTCLICGKPIYIRSIDSHEGIHLIKGCFKHSYNYYAMSVTLPGKNLLVFNKEGLLTSVTIQRINISCDPPVDISTMMDLYNESQFEVFLQNWKILA